MGDSQHVAQRTLSVPTRTITGKPVYGESCYRVTMCPAPPDTGLVFRVMGVDIPCTPDYLSPVAGKWTSLMKDGVIVHTTEHIVSALRGMEIDNCFIHLGGERVLGPCGLPVLDGSALEFARAIFDAGQVEQDRPRRYFEVSRQKGMSMLMPSYKGGLQGREAYLVAWPNDHLSVSYVLDYSPLALGVQELNVVSMDPETYLGDIAPARTFLTTWEVDRYRPYGPEQMWGSMIYEMPIISEENVFEERLHSEAARHKALDLMGDIGLLGFVKGWFLGVRSGHTLNTRMVGELWTS